MWTFRAESKEKGHISQKKQGQISKHGMLQEDGQRKRKLGLHFMSTKTHRKETTQIILRMKMMTTYNIKLKNRIMLYMPQSENLTEKVTCLGQATARYH